MVPTATQLFAVAHDTPASSPPLGLSGTAIDQVVPFQCSIAVPGSSSLMSKRRPTAKQLVGMAHDTAASAMRSGRSGLGLGVTVQAEAATAGSAANAMAPAIRPVARKTRPTTSRRWRRRPRGPYAAR